jgi:heavy metal translocating P-type ATPase
MADMANPFARIAGAGRGALSERFFRWALLFIGIVGLLLGLLAWAVDRSELAHWSWAGGTAPVVIGLLVSMIRDFLTGRVGVDAVAFVSMSGALALGQYLAGIVIAVMYAGGNILEDVAVARAERDLRSLIDRAPKIAHRRVGTAIEDTPIDEVVVGDAILVRAGEVIPVDGVIVSRQAMLDEGAVTGEPIPITRQAGELARSGSVNAGETFELRASTTAKESTYGGIVRMVSAAQTAKAPFVRMADRFALLLLPVTLLVAGSAWWLSGDPIRALAVLVASTPCPLILAAPVALVSGVSTAARRGVIVKGASAIEALGRTRSVVFDKTGTLTLGNPEVERIVPLDGVAPDEILRLAASVDQLSAHTFARSLVAAARERSLRLDVPVSAAEGVGEGITGLVGAQTVLVGSAAYAEREGIGREGLARAAATAADRPHGRILVAVDGEAAGVVVMTDSLRGDARSLPRDLHRLGVTHVAIASGDHADATEHIGRELGVDAVYAGLTPAEKLDLCVRLRSHPGRAPVAMVGDGINDAPALAAADVGIALGTGAGTAAAETADVVIVDDRIGRVTEALRIGRRSLAIARQSILAGIGLSVVGMAFAAAGYLPPVAGALTQEVIDVAVIANALRALRAPVRDGENFLTSGRHTEAT